MFSNTRRACATAWLRIRSSRRAVALSTVPDTRTEAAAKPSRCQRHSNGRPRRRDLVRTSRQTSKTPGAVFHEPKSDRAAVPQRGDLPIKPSLSTIHDQWRLSSSALGLWMPTLSRPARGRCSGEFRRLGGAASAALVYLRHLWCEALSGCDRRQRAVGGLGSAACGRVLRGLVNEAVQPSKRCADDARYLHLADVDDGARSAPASCPVQSAAAGSPESSFNACGTRIAHVRSRKWRLISPAIVETAKELNAMPRAGSSRSIALSSPIAATCRMSSDGSAGVR
jgi:hypothetical protein